jgi:hypothetical protein
MSPGTRGDEKRRPNTSGGAIFAISPYRQLKECTDIVERGNAEQISVLAKPKSKGAITLKSKPGLGIPAVTLNADKNMWIFLERSKHREGVATPLNPEPGPGLPTAVTPSCLGRSKRR